MTAYTTRHRRFYLKHKEKLIKQAKECYHQNKVSILAKKLGVSEQEVVAGIEKAKGRCEICGEEAKLVIDHDHKTGKFRGMLCGACNHGLGNFRDNPQVLKAAIKYLHISLAV